MRKASIWVTAAAALTLLTAGWTGFRPHTSSPRASSSTITFEGNTGVTFTDNFNPFDTQSFATSLAVRSLVYEPLVIFDVLKANVVHPWLATSYKYSDSGKALTFTIRKGVKFSNGKPFTAADVAFTFNLIRANPAANYSGVPPMSKNATVKGNKVTLHFTSPAYTDLYEIGGSTFIVGKAQWSGIKSPATATITKPIGTGPYVLSHFTSQAVEYSRNNKYWGGRPPIAHVKVPSYSTNEAASSALASGQLDWAGNDIPNIKQVFINKDKKHNHDFFAPGSTVTLIFNVKRGALGSALVRQAISYGINRDKLSTIGESGYEAPATSSSGLILPNQKNYLMKAYKGDLPGRPDTKKMTSLLKKAGYKKVGKWWEKAGKKIKFTIIDPTAYSDYFEDENLIATELQKEGIDASYSGVATSAWYNDYPIGDFDATIHWGSGGVSPFVQYQNWMDYTLSAPIGKPATADYGRYHNAAAQRALTKLEATDPSKTKDIMKATDTLEKLFSTQVPQAPLLYGADWDEYSTKHFTGFSTPSNPYMDPSPGDPQLPYILMHLKVVK
jgi:peptide/nickel transport system substrate-binding protein